MNEKELIKKRFNLIIEKPIPGVGEPGQRGFYDISEEEVKRMVEKGAKVERIIQAEFKSKGYLTRKQEFKSEERLKKARRRR